MGATPRPGDPAITPALVAEHGLTPEEYDRLVALKGKYDPQNFFSVNQNVKPGDRRQSGQ